MLTIDGAAGEGGGQVIRTALGLSLVTGTPFEIRNIRAKRKRPGLLRQHLTAVEAAARIGEADLEGARLHSDRLTFFPHGLDAGTYTFDVQTAGSATLVLQTVLPALLRADGPSHVTVHGGTHNPLAPPFDYLERVFLPVLRRMGGRVEMELERAGFYPAGGGEIRVSVEPSRLEPLDLLERGRIRKRRATSIVANLPRHVAERELEVVKKKLGWQKSELKIAEPEADGPGNVLLLEVRAEHASEMATAFGAPGLPAERVADKAVKRLRRYLKADVPVGEHLADQLLVPFAMAGGGSFRTLPLTTHATTNAELIAKFLPVRFEVEGDLVRVA